MKLFFRTRREDLKLLNFILEELDFTQFELNCFDDKENCVIRMEDASFRDIFNFMDNLFYSYSGADEITFPMGSVLIYHKKDRNIYIDFKDFEGQSDIRPFDEAINPDYGLDIDDFDIDSGNYFIAIKSPGGFYCYQLSGDPYK
jgi:hypothetical protein